MFVHHGSPCYHHHRTHIAKGSDEDLVEITVVFTNELSPHSMFGFINLAKENAQNNKGRCSPVIPKQGSIFLESCTFVVDGDFLSTE